MFDNIVKDFIYWKPFYLVSLSMFVLFLVLLPFATVFSMVILFSIISLWSRIIPMLMPLAREVDVIDFFVLIIAINISSISAAVFGVFNMLFSRLFGPTENFHYTIKDSLAYFFGAFLLPFLYGTTQDLLTTITFFVIFRYLVRLTITFCVDRDCIFEEILVILASMPIALATNSILVGFLGPTTSQLLSGGIKFSLELFILATVVLGLPLVLKHLKQHRNKTEQKIETRSLNYYVQN